MIVSLTVYFEAPTQSSSRVVPQTSQPLQPAASSRLTRLSDIYTSIQQDRTIRLWRHAADKVRIIILFIYIRFVAPLVKSLVAAKSWTKKWKGTISVECQVNVNCKLTDLA